MQVNRKYILWAIFAALALFFGGDWLLRIAVRDPLEQANAKTKQTDRVSTISVADTMTYDDAKRRATYKPKAHATGPQGDLHADTIEMYLKASGSELDRIEAYTKVTTKDPNRWAVGDRMTYFADDERYVMMGKPVRLCADSSETTGAILKFEKASNTISIEGSEEFRTQRKNGVLCGEPPK
jgi:lipopolysaccharide export system protein LptA